MRTAKENNSNSKRSFSGEMLFILTSLLLAVLLQACGGEIGSGNSTSQSRDVAVFDKIHASWDFEVYVSVGDVWSVVVTGDDNLIKQYKTMVVDGTLNISCSADVWPKVQPIVEITVPTLNGIHASGTSNVVVQNILAHHFKAQVDGPADLILSGQTENLVLVQSDRGNVWAKDLHTHQVDGQLEGSGSATVSAEETISAQLSGQGHMVVHGHPAHRQVSISGPGYVTYR